MLCCLGDLGRRHVAETDVADETLLLKLGKCGDLLFDRSFSGGVDIAGDSHVDDVERVQPKVAKIVVDRALDIRRLERRYPRAVCTTQGAHLGDDHEVIWVRMEGFANDLVGDVRPVKVARIDMIDARGHRFAQYGDGCVTILGRPEYAGTGQLHGTVAHPVDRATGERERAYGGDFRHGDSPRKECRVPGRQYATP
jgi:hypothetical protein